MVKVQFLLTFVGCLSLCHAYPTGPPPAACGGMAPRHGPNTPQTSAAPYSIAISSNIYRRGQNLTVTVTANAPTATPFKGFYVQARRSDRSNTTPMGRFYLGRETEIKLNSCPGGVNNAVSHSSAVNKTSKTFIWNNEAGSDVIFQGTFVHNFTTFWTGVQSATVSENTTGLTTATPMLTTTSAGPAFTCNIPIVSLLVVLVLACRQLA